MDMTAYTIEAIARIRDRSPLVHNITNFVVMNSSANILLAMGASPVMAHCRSEVAEMAAMAGALVLNIGTIEEAWLDSMLAAAHAANEANIPVVLDPVGAGATKLRSDAVRKIMAESRVSVLRGNCSEVLSLADQGIKTKGVDSGISMSDTMVDSARRIAADNRCVVAISGEEDCITDGVGVYRVKNGHPIMTRVTGIGCGLTAVVAAFCAVDPEKDFSAATAAAFGFYGLCGELAARVSDKPGSFPAAFLDHLYSIGPEEIENHLKVSRD